MTLIIICSLNAVSGQPAKVKEAEQKKKDLEQQQHEMAVSKRNARLQKHFDMQSPDVKKRMKANQKLTERYYRRILGRDWFHCIFKKRKPYKY